MRRSAVQTACNSLVSHSSRGGWVALSFLVDLQGFFGVFKKAMLKPTAPKLTGVKSVFLNVLTPR